jgi:predicted AAA+ superfamily ATPase
MNYFERSLVPLLVREFEKQQPVFQVLTGPRQVGKTTIAEQVMDKLPFPSVYACADSPLPPGPEWIETQWRRAEVEAGRSGGVVLLVLDEVQKVRGWSESLKSKWDAARRTSRDIRLLVLGSSALLIRVGLSESLAGRFSCIVAATGRFRNALTPSVGICRAGSISVVILARQSLATTSGSGSGT